MTILQPGTGPRPGDHYLPATPDTVRWGRLPLPSTAPVLTIRSGETVTVDTISHEGVMEAQGRDPLSYFGNYGVAKEDVLEDAVAFAAADIAHTPGQDGPHIVTGPIHVEGARAGQILKIEYLALDQRVPYGVVSSLHGMGAIPGEQPKDDVTGELVPRISQFCTTDEVGAMGQMRFGDRRITFPLDPFLGISGVTPSDTSDAAGLNTVPPGAYGGNLDVRDLGRGSTMYLPIQVDGAGFYVGDPHFAQGNGEISLTALEASLRATMRLTVLDGTDATAVAGTLDGPFGETASHWIAVGLDVDLDVAMQKCVREAIRILHQVAEVPESIAYLYLSAAGDFAVSQVVDNVKGVHCLIRKADFPDWC